MGANSRTGRGGDGVTAHGQAAVWPVGMWFVRSVSLESALYIGAVVLAILLRLILLDARPLSMEEGALAMESHRIWQGTPPASLSQGPFTVFANALLLAMFAGGDGAARLFSAVAGIAIVAAPYLFRETLGRTAALLAALALALSPLMVFASRTVGSGAVPLSLAVVLMWLAIGRVRWSPAARAYAVAIVSSALITTGRDGISIALALAIATILSSNSVAGFVQGARMASNDPTWRRAGIVFVLSTLAIGTGLGTHLAGVQWAAVDVWRQWLSAFSLEAPRGPVVLLLLLYEFPIVLLGVAQVLRTVFLRNRVDTFLALWASSLMLMAMLQDAPHSSRLILQMLPLYLLAARLAAGGVWILAYRRSGWGWSLATTALACPLVVGFILLNRATNPALDLPDFYLFGELALVGVAVLSVGFLVRGRSRLALAWVALAVLSTGYLIHNTAFLNFRTTTASSEPAIGTYPSEALREAAMEASYFARYSGTQLAIDSELYTIAGWYLRDAQEGTWSRHGPQVLSISLLPAGVSPTPLDGERRPAVFSPVVDPARLRWQETWRWLVDRSALIDQNQRDIILRAPAGNW